MASQQEEKDHDPGKHTTSSAAGRADREAPAAPLPPHRQHDEEEYENEGGKQNKSAMADAIKRGGLAGWASYLTFSWAGPFLKLGSAVTLKVDDLDGIYETHKSRNLFDTLRLNWERERARMGEDAARNRGRRKGMTLLRALIVTFRGPLMISGLVMVADCSAHVAQAMMLGRLIGYFEDENAASWEGWVYAAAVVLSGTLFSVFHHHYSFLVYILGMQLRISTTAIIYDKILRLRLSSLGQVSIGHLMNLATSDVERFQQGGIFVNYLWGAPLETLVILYLGLGQVGPSFLAGFAALALLVPLQALFSRKFATVRQRVTTLTDERVKLTNQAITGARLMKINAWEPALEKEIQRVRSEEIRVLLTATTLRAVNEAMFFAQPAVLACLVFTTYHLLGNVLTPPKVFTTLALLNITQFTMGRFFNLAVQNCSESWVSIQRIESILLMEENDVLGAPLREADIMIAGPTGKQQHGRGNAPTAIVAAAAPDVVANAVEAPRSTLTGNGTLPSSSTSATFASSVTIKNNGGGARLSPPQPQLPAPVEEAVTTTKMMTRVVTIGEKASPAGKTNGVAVNEGGEVTTNRSLVPTNGATPASVAAAAAAAAAADVTTAVEKRQPQTALFAGAVVGAGGETKKEAGRSPAPKTSRQVANGGGGGIDGNGGLEQPGLIELKGASFRWASGKVEDEHANIFRSLVESPAEKTKRSNRRASRGGGGPNPSMRVQQGEDEAGFVLDAIDLRIEPGKLVGIVGPVGSAKSSLLMAVLREIYPESVEGVRMATIPDVSGEHETGVSVGGTLAYASQEPWIQSGTLRENILFGRRMNRERYETVLRDCSLERDLSILPSGDMTGIGDRGVNLSGGQKARVGLARMAYAHADTYLMDDPLSAVDPAVGRELFSRVVCGRLSGSTRILVTHQVHFLTDPAVDEIIVMGHGKIVARGSYDNLEVNGSLAALERPVSPIKDLAMMGAAEDTSPRQGGHHYSPRSTSSSSAKPIGTTVSPSSPFKAGQPTGVSFLANGNATTSPSNRATGTGTNDVGKCCPSLSHANAEDVSGTQSASSRDDGAEEKEEQELGGAGELDLPLEADKLVGGVVTHRMRSKSSMCRSEASLSMARQEEAGGVKKAGVPPELVVAEDTESGVLKRGTYLEYTREAAGVCQVVLILVSMAGGQALILAVTVWIAKWSRQSEEEQKRARYLLVLILLTVAALVVSLFRALVTFTSLVRASHRLHDRMLKRIIRAPILFFDSNPVGRILNRFTKDTHFMDDLLPLTTYDFIVCAFMVFGGVLIVFIVNPWVVLSMLPATAYFRYIQGFYLKTSREVKRLDGVTRSPVFSQLSETLDGLVTIRAFGTQHRFMKQFTERVDTNTRAYFAWVYNARWLGFRMEVVVIIVTTASCFFSVAVNEYSGSVDAGLLGAALVYVLQLGGLFQWVVRQSSEVENQMVSAERVLEYCRVPQEANLESDPENKPSEEWPSKGKIEIRNMVLRYRDDLPPVLKGLNLSIPGGSRVGVVGRTGAGKSSLISALFRLVEYDGDRGGVEIDGVDIAKIGLHDLRPRMSVVPQTPFLFSGSMRLNLDPFGKQSDVDMWAALEAVQMKEYINALPEGLDAPVSEGGGNLSVGQRQLLCLARAVLQRSQILVMDEATANIDQNTDFLIQDVVRTSFKGRTVIMVAHRLNTVIDCDQVVVLSEGRVVEAGHPHLLLQASAAAAAAKTTAVEHQESGMSVSGKAPSELVPVPLPKATLSSMVGETGPASSEHLRRLAREAWEGLDIGANLNPGTAIA